MASTSSYDYWWPYPAWGATTAEGAATAVPLASTPAPSLVTISVTDSALSSVVHPVATSSASTTSSGSIIRITALPPSNGTSSQKSTAYSHSGFDIAYLAPLFAVLAAIAGALFTWYLLRWQVRRRDKQGHGSSILHSGPRYAPPPGFTEDSAPQGSSSSGSATESSKLLRGRTDSKKEGWLARAFSRSSRHSQAMSAAAPVTPISVVGRQLSSRVPRTSMNNLYSAVEDDANSEDAGAMPMDSNGPERSGTRLPGQIASPELLSPGDDDVPYDTLRHKSIRRAIMERLKFGTLRRPAKDKAEYLPDVETGRVPGTPVRRVSSRRGHRRNDPDFNVEDLQRAGSAGNPSRANSLMREMAGRPPILSPPGFRIIEEDTEADMHGADHEHGHLLGRDRLEDGSEGGTPARENPAWKWIASWSPSPSIRTEDSYTALPVKRSPTKRSGPVACAPSLSRTDEYPPVAPPLARVDSSVLPSSPPQVMSPPLHSQLFFSEFGSTPSLDLQVSADRYNAPGGSAPTPERRANKLHTRREPDPLPFPSTSTSSPYRGRLKKPHHWHVVPLSPPMPSSPEVVALYHPRHAPDFPATASPAADEKVDAERLLVRQSALDKVGEIVSRGLSQRDLANAPGTGESIVEVDALPGLAADRITRMEARDGFSAAAAIGDGIEQRLGLLRAEESATIERHVLRCYLHGFEILDRLIQSQCCASDRPTAVPAFSVVPPGRNPTKSTAPTDRSEIRPFRPQESRNPRDMSPPVAVVRALVCSTKQMNIERPSPATVRNGEVGKMCGAALGGVGGNSRYGSRTSGTAVHYGT
ncbi:uncharacterized protein C8Q71DRAFT_893138 [Rhodofomes roseus]|uniref:Uncharacterized protein n=1 Tax=Rhodofomes roseus TaxID=34475 RepID=A0ABQ8KPB4_9APHY|nr:uncharacterized protein C8Q71DRAFT_893138 [Rhodofomes roseus]KAH9840151.1 hypothetical protein C8Q71DRAFT_893138 [Rhodofomes roseus]